MGDLTGTLSGIGDSIGSLFSSAPAAADQGFVDTGAFTAPLSDAAAAAQPVADLSGISGANLLGSGIDTGAFTTPLTDVASQAASIPFQAGVQPGQTTPLFMGMEQPSTGAAAPTGTGAPAAAPGVTDTGIFTTTSAPTGTPAAVTPTGGNIPVAGGVGGGGGQTALANSLETSGNIGSDFSGGGGNPTISTSAPSDTSSAITPGSTSQGGVLDWLSKQLTGPGSLKNDISMLAALGGLGMSAFKPNAIPGAGQTLTPSGTSTGQSVANAQQQQQLAAQEAATQAQQQQLAQQEQTIAGTQTAGAAPLMATGQQQVAAAASGQLLPAQQAQVAAALAANQQQIRAKYANLGLSGSTMEQSDLNQANLQSQALIASLLNQNQTQGLTTVTGAENLLAGGGASLAGASGDINTAVNALNQSVAALGSSSGTYMNILQQQLAQDQELQKALGQMAQSLGTSTALSNLGNTAGTAGTTT